MSANPKEKCQKGKHSENQSGIHVTFLSERKGIHIWTESASSLLICICDNTSPTGRPTPDPRNEGLSPIPFDSSEEELPPVGQNHPPVPAIDLTASPPTSQPGLGVELPDRGIPVKTPPVEGSRYPSHLKNPIAWHIPGVCIQSMSSPGTTMLSTKNLFSKPKTADWLLSEAVSLYGHIHFFNHFPRLPRSTLRLQVITPRSSDTSPDSSFITCDHSPD